MSNSVTDRAARSFYTFMIKREEIRRRKAAGKPWPWTDDHILRDYSFTNVKRYDDKTTKMLIDTFYSRCKDQREVVLLNCATFRYFGTWEFATRLGWQRDFNPREIKRCVKEAQKLGEPVFTGAYIITSGGRTGKKQDYVVDVVLKDLWKHATVICGIAVKTQKWQPVIEYMGDEVMGFSSSGFMAKEVILDTRHVQGFWPTGDFLDKNQWTPVGPGSKLGAGFILGAKEKHRLSNEDTVTVCQQLFAHQAKLWPFVDMPLELHDIQFQLCEYAKYTKVKLGLGRPRRKYQPPAAIID